MSKTRTPDYLSLIFICAGLLLFLVGYMFHYFRWPDMFYGIIASPVIFGIGIIILIVKKAVK
jgi:hypothetical protein